MERSILSWKEPFEVGKLEMKLERYVVVGKIICRWEDIEDPSFQLKTPQLKTFQLNDVSNFTFQLNVSRYYCKKSRMDIGLTYLWLGPVKVDDRVPK